MKISQQWEACGTALEFSLCQQCEITLHTVRTLIMCACMCAFERKKKKWRMRRSLDKQSEAASPMLIQQLLVAFTCRVLV